MGTEPGWYLGQLISRDATYVVGYPDWLSFVRTAPGCFEEQHRVVLDQKDICGAEEMVAYRIDRRKLREFLAGR